MTVDIIFEVQHQTGKKHIDAVKTLYGEETLEMKSIELFPFIEDLDFILSAS